MLVRLDLSTWTPTVEDRVQLLAPLASVKPVGADPNFEMLPKALVAAAVPVPDVVPPALSIVSEIELSTVPVTVSVPLEVAADAGESPEGDRAVVRFSTRSQSSIGFEKEGL